MRGSSFGDFQLSLEVNNTHDLVIFLSASGLRKMHSQDGRASDSERAGRHLLWSAMGIISLMGSMYQ